MAEVTAMRNNALPYPIYGVAWTIVFPLLDADGDLVTGASTPDSEVSKNGDTFADCTNEMTEIATSSGVYYLTLTASEMTADVVTVIAKSATSGMKTTVAVLYPRKLVAFKASATSQTGAAGSITFDSGASAIDDFYNGMLIVATLDTLVEARICTDYVGSTKVASVTPNWNTTPDSDDTFIVYLLPEQNYLASAANVIAWNGTAIASPDTAGYPKVTIKDGTGTGEIDTSSGGVLVSSIAANAITATAIASDAITAAKIASDAITAAKIANDAITAAKIADGAIDAATFTAGAINAAAIATDAITAAKIAADAIGASELAADAVTEIQSGLSTLNAAGVRTAVGLASADLDTQLAAIAGYIDTEVAAIKAKTDLIPGTQDGKTFAETILLMAAVLIGKASGLGTTTAVYRAVDDSQDRVTATVDGDGNRSAITLDTSSP